MTAELCGHKDNFFLSFGRKKEKKNGAFADAIEFFSRKHWHLVPEKTYHNKTYNMEQRF